MSKTKCESCTMPIETGPYCDYCKDEHGNLKPFEERFASMVSWVKKRDPSISQEKAEEQTLAFMAELPAWRNHPDFLARKGR